MNIMSISRGANKTIYIALESEMQGVLGNPLMFMYERIRAITEYQNYYALFPILGEVIEPIVAEKEKERILDIIEYIQDWIFTNKLDLKRTKDNKFIILKMKLTYKDVINDKIIKNMTKHLGLYRR